MQIPLYFVKKSLMAKRNAKNIVLPHSQAKLDLFKIYLEKYLPILTLAKGITKINIYDIFCGSGVYEDGNIGSPLIAVECVRKTNQLMDKNNWTKKPITLSINDQWGGTNKKKTGRELRGKLYNEMPSIEKLEEVAV
jgi:hypothetical protein